MAGIPPLPAGAEHPVYNTQAVVQLTGVPAPTFRAWERRYGVPRPARLPGGQRLYSERDVALIRWLHQRTEEGVAISRAVALLATREGQPSMLPAAAPRAFPQLQAELLDRLQAFDTIGAQTTLAEAFALYSVERVCLELIQPTLVEIGERWHAGGISVAMEHYATNLIRRKLLSLLDIYDSRADGRLALLACAPNELHEVGLLLVALFLARRGWPVVYLGAAVPLEDLDAAIRQLQPRLVVLSASTAETAHGLREAAALVDRLPKPRPRLAYGGRAFEENGQIAHDLPGIYLGPDARSAAERTDALLGGAPAR
jgi:DNA-binding transcriptional MerR regulator